MNLKEEEKAKPDPKESGKGPGMRQGDSKLKLKYFEEVQSLQEIIQDIEELNKRLRYHWIFAKLSHFKEKLGVYSVYHGFGLGRSLDVLRLIWGWRNKSKMEILAELKLKMSFVGNFNPNNIFARLVYRLSMAKPKVTVRIVKERIQNGNQEKWELMWK